MEFRNACSWSLLRYFAAVAVILVCIGVAVPLARALETRSLLGTWETNFGPITITEADDTTFVGIYAYQNKPARIYAVRTDQGMYEGYWVQETSEVICGGAKKGRNTWGRFRFAFTGSKFLGLWNYCDRSLVNQKQFHWRGSLVNRNN